MKEVMVAKALLVFPVCIPNHTIVNKSVAKILEATIKVAALDPYYGRAFLRLHFDHLPWSMPTCVIC